MQLSSDKINSLKDIKINILITGATGVGKSSTINAICNDNVAKVGQGVDPETMGVIQYKMNNLFIYDSAGLGDGKEADKVHSKNIIEKLYEKDQNGNMLVDLVIVVVDGNTRDLGTSFDLINKIIIPNFNEEQRILIAINKADMADSGRGWDHESNKPNEKLIAFLDDKVASTKKRIKEATGVETTPIYYVAGFKDSNEKQKTYNLVKVLEFIINGCQLEKRKDVRQVERIEEYGGIKKIKSKLKQKLSDLDDQLSQHERVTHVYDRAWRVEDEHDDDKPKYGSWFYDRKMDAWEERRDIVQDKRCKEQNNLEIVSKNIEILKEEIIILKSLI